MNNGSLGTTIDECGKTYLRFSNGGKWLPRVFVCDSKGGGKLGKAEFEKRRLEIAASLGLVAGEMGEATKQSITFKAAAESWLSQCQSRKRNPIKTATARGYSCYVRKLNEMIGSTPLALITNKTLKEVVQSLHNDKLSAKTIVETVAVIKYVVASILDDDGAQVYPRTWNSDFIDMPIIGKQHQPTFSAAQIEAIIAADGGGRYSVLYALLAGTGMRAGEALAIELGPQSDSHTTISSDCKTIYVRKSVLGTLLQSPKTATSTREIDVCCALAAYLKAFIGNRTSGWLFPSDTGKPLLQSNILRDSLHPIEIGYKSINSKGAVVTEVAGVLGNVTVGFHAFRRFRETVLELASVPTNLVDQQIGHKGKSVAAASYFKPQHSLKRVSILEDCGLGFALPQLPQQKIVSISSVEKAA